ncbi:MAG: hypothetical protein LH632_10060 [Rhodoferax sp.]|nr:hypothetical protein [Rhodoferax sp.]
MKHLPITVVRNYVFGLVCTCVGAWLTEISASLLPLALGGAALVMATVPLVRAMRGIRSKHPERR